MLKKDFAESATAFVKKGVQYYHLRINPVEKDGVVECISAVLDHEPTQEDKDRLYGEYLALCKSVQIAQVDSHDKSEAVNGFYIGDIHAWLDKATRVGLANSIAIEKAAGVTETTLYLNGAALTIGVEQAQQMLSALELYALDCYRRTEQHKIAIGNLTTIEEVESYNYTTGYPEQPRFEV